MNDLADRPWRTYDVPASWDRDTPPPAVDDGAPLRPRITLEWADQMPDEDQDLREIVQGVLTTGAMSCMYGESNSGKSYLATHLAFCMSRGVPWLGRRVEKGAVIYIAGEGAASVRRRIRAHEQHHGCKVGAFGLIPHALSLLDGSADVEALVELIRNCQSDIGEQVQLVIIDTLARAMPGANENSGEDMSRLVAAGDRIREATGAHLLWIHHSGKDTAKGARGHSSLRASIDTEIEVTASQAEHLHTAIVTKQRDLDTHGLRLCGRFVGVNLGTNQWGDPITACAVVDADAPAPKRKPVKLGALQEIVMAALSGAGGDMKVAELAALLAPQGKSKSNVYNAVERLQELGVLEVSVGRVHVLNAA